MTVLRLASAEFARAFFRRAPGGRDWAFVTALLVLLQLLALVMMSARVGVLERSVDAFLGNEPGYGVPVWVRQNYLSERPTEAISAELVAALEAASPNHSVEPFRRVVNGELVSLPDSLTWLEQAEESDIAFSGLVGELTPDSTKGSKSPFYPNIVESQVPSGPHADILKNAWPIVLDLDQFEQYFDLDTYRRSVAGQLPKSLYDSIPSDASRMREMNVIWLRVQRFRSPTLVPFTVTWGRYLGTGHLRPDFILPFDFHTVFTSVRDNPKLCLEVASGPSLALPIEQIESIYLLANSPESRERKISEIQSALALLAEVAGGDIVNTSARVSWTAPPARSSQNCRGSVPWITAELFLAEAGLDASLIEPIERRVPSEVTVSGTILTVPCGLLAPNTRRRVLGAERFSAECAENKVEVDQAQGHHGYNQILMFVRDRTEIDSLVEYISCRDPDTARASEILCHLPDEEYDTIESRVALHPIYEDSLSRFGFLSKLLEAISGPIGMIIGAVIFAMLFVQLGTVIGHRLGQYATLIVNGVRHRQIYAIVTLQIIMSVLAAFAIATLLFVLVRIWLLFETGQLAIDHARITLGGSIDILPVPWAGMPTLLGATLFLGGALGAIHLYFKGVWARKSLDSLL